MSNSEKNPRSYRNVNPEDYYGYEEKYIQKGGGSGEGKKDGGRKGKKTLQALKRNQREKARERRQEEARGSLKNVLADLPQPDNREREKLILERYTNWLNRALRGKFRVKKTHLEESRSKSSGPGGQHVNKRETQVSLTHIPSGIRAESAQTRSQRRNRKLAKQQLEDRLRDHLEDWQTYLGDKQQVSLEEVQEMLDQHK
ncbi:MAG: peptide chain release factor-like protein [Anaerolineales bacterium]|nr:peptide chain release factor-like protein [Anaerolineales bacterium]